MTSPPVLDLVTELTPVPDTPDGVFCWAGRLRLLPDVRVSLLLDAQPVDVLDAAFIDHVCAGVDRLLTAAAAAAGLEGAVARWDPELTFRAGRSWEVRFTEAPGPTELGLLVVFDGEEITEVDDMSDWEF